jgi:hypothetical protein
VGAWVVVAADGSVTYRRCLCCSEAFEGVASRRGFCPRCWARLRLLPERARGLRSSALALDRRAYGEAQDRLAGSLLLARARELVQDAGLGRHDQPRLDGYADAD